ncbi:hypothetical protein DFJ73DRAFT_842028 [Zopfochytrium polystomum]|nr:hypothetical protein DFJ73DRAFT_842028 [Zopfochytrium polystomum]
MSSRETSISLPSSFRPLERVILTANGNVQRIFSAFYNLPVTVEIVRNVRKPKAHFSDPLSLVEYDREVRLVVGGKTCCTATSVVKLFDDIQRRLVEDQQVGIGQLFRYQSILPEFELLQVGRVDGHFWREYVLQSKGVRCEIKETFPDDAFAFAFAGSGAVSDEQRVQGVQELN